MRILMSIATATLCCFLKAYGQDLLTMDVYIDQVKAKNASYSAVARTRESAFDAVSMTEIGTAPVVFADANWSRDKKPSLNPPLQYERADSSAYSLGVSKNTLFGMKARLSYDVSSQSYLNSNASALGYNNVTKIATPSIAFNQSLWQNGFGRELRARLDEHRAQVDSQRFAAEMQQDLTVQNAKMAYWNLVVASDVVKIQENARSLSQSILDYISLQNRRNLMDESDVLASKASLDVRHLDVQVAKDNEQVALRAFNTLRGAESDTQPARLAPVNWTDLESLTLEKFPGDSAETRAAEARSRAELASAKVFEEQTKPVFEVSGSYGLNGIAETTSKANADALSAKYPTLQFGVHFAMPTDFDLLKRARSSSALQARAAQLSHQQKVLEQLATWDDLRARLKETQRRFHLSQTIEQAQKSKLEFERKRMREGRSSTYNLLLYQQDYSVAQLNKMNLARDMIAIVSQIDLYTSSHNEGSK